MRKEELVFLEERLKLQDDVVLDMEDIGLEDNSF